MEKGERQEMGSGSSLFNLFCFFNRFSFKRIGHKVVKSPKGKCLGGHCLQWDQGQVGGWDGSWVSERKQGSPHGGGHG